VSFLLYNPDGTINSTSTGGYYGEQCSTAQTSGCDFSLTDLPQTGTYVLMAAPSPSFGGSVLAQTMSTTISVTSP